MAKKKKLRTAAYCRVSSTSDLQDGSFEFQREYFRKLISENSELEFVGIYGDCGRSGRSMEGRPELTRLLRDCSGGKIDLIATKSVSRFARNMRECVETVRRLSELGVGIVFEREGLDSRTMQGELVLGLLAAIAQEESASLSRNMRWSRWKNLERGRPWEPARYGYRAVGSERRWEIVPREAAIVRRAFFMAGTRRVYPEICAELTRMERESGSARVWNRTPVRNMLRSRVYIGDYLSHKECSIVDLSGRVKRVKNRGHCDQILIEGRHPAIVGHDLFYAVQAALDAGLLSSRRSRFSERDREIARRAKTAAEEEAKRW